MSAVLLIFAICDFWREKKNQRSESVVISGDLCVFAVL